MPSLFHISYESFETANLQATTTRKGTMKKCIFTHQRGWIINGKSRRCCGSFITLPLGNGKCQLEMHLHGWLIWSSTRLHWRLVLELEVNTDFLTLSNQPEELLTKLLQLAAGSCPVLGSWRTLQTYSIVWTLNTSDIIHHNIKWNENDSEELETANAIYRREIRIVASFWNFDSTLPFSYYGTPFWKKVK